MKKRLLSTILSFTLVASTFAGCGSSGNNNQGNNNSDPGSGNGASSSDASNLTGIDAIIKEAEGMSMEELAKKAIEESNGKTFLIFFFNFLSDVK